MSANKRKKNKSIFLQSVFEIALLCAVLFYLLCMVIKLIKNPTETFMVEKGKVSMEEEGIAYVIKDEHMLISDNNEGYKIKEIKTEGTKVSGGEAIFSYISSYNDDINEKISSLNEEISSALKEQTDIYSSDIKVLENSIKTELFNGTKANDVKKINEYSENLNGYLEKKSKIIGTLSGTQLDQLIKQREKLKNELTNTDETIKTKESGIVSYRVDGFEDVLSFEQIDNLSSDLLEGLNIKTGELATISDNKAKVINNFKCYLAVNLNSDNALNVEVGKSLIVRISDGTEIPVTVYKIIDNENSKLIIFEATRNIEKLLNYRKVSIDVIWWSEEGLKIPIESIKNIRNVDISENETITVGEITKVRTGYNQEISVKILKENEKFAIIENLANSEYLVINHDKNENEILNQGSISLYDEVLRKNK